MPGRQSVAFTLVEVVLCLGIIAFVAVMLMGLLPAGIRNSRLATESTSASAILEAIEAEVQSSSTNANTGMGLDPRLLSTNAADVVITNYIAPSGLMTNSSASARYGVVISKSGVGKLTSTDTNYPATAYGLSIWWPAQAAWQNAEGRLDGHITILRKK